jgi:linoleoyl-CoA desaturase
MNVLSPPQVKGLLESMAAGPVEVAAARRRLHRKSVVIVVLWAASYYGLVFAPLPFVGRIACALLLVVACVAVATGIMHDGNHGAYSASKRVNRVAGYSSDLLGASSFLWRFKHNHLHHGNTNVVGFDTDIDQAPFARLAPQQPWHVWNRYQHVYMWLLYGFLTLQWFLLSDLTTIVTGRQAGHTLPKQLQKRDIAMILFGKALHAAWAIVVPSLFFPFWQVVLFYVGCSWLVGFVLANFFQMAHCVDVAEMATPATPRRGPDFALHQLRTTVDVQLGTSPIGRFVGWWMGGLDHQVEHHLAPKLPHTLYSALKPRLDIACAARGVERRRHRSFPAAIRSHERWLRRMGRPGPSAEAMR